MSSTTADPGSTPPILSRSNLSYHLYRLVNQPEKILGILCLALLSFLVLVPLFEIIHDALVYQSYDLAYRPEAKVGSFTLFHLERVFTGPLSRALFLKPLFDSVAVGACVTVLAVSVGTGLAWLMVRTDIGFKGVFGALAVVPYMMPSWVLALAWLSLFKNDRIGGNEGMITSFFGVQPPDWVSYGFFPIVICLALHYYAYGYLLMSGALATVDSELEEAGAISGMNRRQRLWRITFPLLLPALGSAVVLTFIRILGTFGTPALLGLPVRFFTFSTQIYASLNARNSGDAFVLALVLIVMAITFIWINSRVIGVRRSFVTLTGKGFRQREIKLGAWRWPATIAVGVFLGVTVVLPMLILLWESLVITPGEYTLKGLTAHFWIGESDIDIANGFTTPASTVFLYAAFTSGEVPALATGIVGAMLFWQWTYASTLYLVSFFVGQKQHRVTTREFYIYIFGPNAIWILIPIVGLYVSIRLILDGDYSVLGLNSVLP